MRNNLRIMRNNVILSALFPATRRSLLSATLVQPNKWWYLSELAQHLRTTPSSLQRELSSLVDAGLLQKRREGTRAYFKAETRSPLYPDLARVFEKTVGVIPALQEVLEPFGDKVACAFVYGSMARGEEHALSDVDLMVIGSVGLAELAPALRRTEERLGREVNITSYSLREFRAKVAARDHFLAAVLRGPKQFVKGNKGDLGKIIG
jgi:predicted nucleotidyltransferase